MTGTIQDAATLVITDMRGDALQLGFTNDSGGALAAGDEVCLKTDGTVDLRDTGTQKPVGIVVKGGADGTRVTVRTPFSAVIKGIATGGTINAGSFVKPNGSKTGGIPQYVVVADNDFSMGLVLKGGTASSTIIIGIMDGVTAFYESSAYTQQEMAAYTADPESSAYTAVVVTTVPATLGDAAAAADLQGLAKLTDVNALRVAYETLRAAYADIRAKLVTAGIIAEP